MLNQRNFLKINTITIGSVFLLILVGSLVRSLGAGMGCPDWPRCFGSYIPPTSSEQLPDDYLDFFRAKRLEKNEQLATILQKLGYNGLAERITNDPLVIQEQEFEVSKAWIEYINRLIGVLIGLLVFLNMFFSFRIKKNPWISVMGISVVVLTGFQGWVGSLVVSTNLLKGFITFHMFMALAILALLIGMNFSVRNSEVVRDKMLALFTIGMLILLIPQILLGTEVRAVIDPLLIHEPDRKLWVSYLTDIFFIHRSYSWLILLGAVLILYLSKKRGYRVIQPQVMCLLGMITMIAIVGIIMVYFNFPFWAQPIHLLLASGIFGMLFYLVLRIRFAQ